MIISQGYVCPWHFRLFGLLLIFGGVAAFSVHIVLFIIMELIGAALVGLKSGISIEVQEGKYQIFNSLFGLRFGSRFKLKRIEKIYLNQNQVKSKMYSAHTATGYTSEDTSYDGYLKFIDGEKIYLKSDKQKKDIDTELKSLAQHLNTEYYDNTSGA